MTRARLARLWVWVAALAALILLAVGVAQIEFSYGSDELIPNWMKILGEKQPDLSGEAEQEKPASLDVWDVLFRIFFWILLPIAVIYYVVSAIVSTEGRLRALAVVVAFLLLMALVAILGGLPNEPVEVTPTPLADEQGTPPDLAIAQAESPDWFVWAVSIVLAVLVVGGGWLLYRRWRRPVSRPLKELAQQAQEAIGEVRAGVSLTDVIKRAYLEMTRILSETRGIQRKAYMTPREFEQRLHEVGLPREHVHRLTQLFERVRYGSKTPGLAEEREAIACLSAIVDACGKRS